MTLRFLQSRPAAVHSNNTIQSRNHPKFAIFLARERQ